MYSLSVRKSRVGHCYSIFASISPHAGKVFIAFQAGGKREIGLENLQS